MARAPSITTLSSVQSLDRLFQRFEWLGDSDDLLARLGISREKLRRLADDDEVSQAMETRRHAVLATPWRIEGRGQRATSFLTDEIGGVIEDLIDAIWEAVPYGYSVCEIVYARRPNGRIGIDRVLKLPFEWYRVKADGSFVLASTGFPEEVPEKFLLSVHRGSIRKPHGEALLAKCYWPWFFRTHGWKMWAKFLENTAVPLLVGKAAGDREAIIEQLKALSTGPVAAVAPDEDIEVQTASPSRNFEAFEVACERRIQRLILGQTLTSGTDGGSGNRALGQVHDKVRDEKRQADMRLVMVQVQEVVRRLVWLNRLPIDAKFVMEDARGLEEDRAERDAVLSGIGVRFTETYFREKYGFEPDDFSLDQSQSSAPQPVMSSALEVTLADDRPRFTAGQQAVDDAVAGLAASAPQPIPPEAIASAIRGARDRAELVARLAVVMSGADDRAFRQVLERAMMAAEINGAIEAERTAEG